MEKLENPAVTTQLAMPPALLHAVGEDPSLLEAIARKMGAINLENLFYVVQQSDAIGPRLELQKLLNKMGRLEPVADPVGAAGGGFVFNINFTGGNSVRIEAQQQIPEQETIDVAPVVVDE